MLEAFQQWEFVHVQARALYPRGAGFIHIKNSCTFRVLVSKIPPKKMIPILKDEAGHPCRASFSVPVRGPGVPSYAAPTVSSIQHSVLQYVL